MTAADDEIILAALRGITPTLNVHDGQVTDSDEVEHTISAPLPYVVFLGSPGTDMADSLDGKSGALLNEFQITFVGEDRWSAQRAGERARAVLNRKFLEFSRGKRLVRRADKSLLVRPDPVWTRPGGGPLFYGADTYTVLT